MKPVCWKALLAGLLGLAFACAHPEPAPIRSPSALAPKPASEALPSVTRVIPVRIYADVAYAEANSGWQVRAYRSLQAVSRTLQAYFGVGLELTRVSRFTAEDPKDLGLALQSLEAVDPAKDGAWVIGLLNGPTPYPKQMALLSASRVLGSHLVVYGESGTEAYDAVASLLSTLPDAEREARFLALELHKDAALLLNGLGRLLGAGELPREGAYTAPIYHTEMGEFPEASRALIAWALQRWPVPKATQRNALKQAYKAFLLDSDRAAGAHALMAELSDPAWPARFQALPRRPGDANRESEEDTEFVNPKDPKEAAQGWLALMGTDPAQAKRGIEAMLTDHAEDPTVLAAACLIFAQQPKAPSRSAVLCQEAIRNNPPLFNLQLALAMAERKAKQPERSMKTLQKAEGLVFLEADKAEAWASIAGLYAKMGYLSLAERAAEYAEKAMPSQKPNGGAQRAPGAETLRWVRSQKRRYNLPKHPEKQGLLAKDEPAYVHLRESLLDALAQKKDARANELASDLKRRFPRLPPPALALCQLRAREGRFQSAKRHCQAALKRPGKSQEARVFLGYIALNQGQGRTAARWFEAARKLEPDRQDLWHLEKTGLEMAGAQRAVRRLKAAYQKRFGERL